MFKKLKELFNKDTPPEYTALSEDLFSSKNPNFITAPDKILALLSEIEQTFSLCTIQIKGATQEYHSSILGIKPDKNLLILDELSPISGNTYLEHNRTLKLSAFHKGINLSFTLSNVEKAESQGTIYLRAPLPTRIFYPQRRRAPRIEISTIDLAFSGTSTRTGLSVHGYLFDLSRGGAGIDLTSNRAHIQRGDTIKNCQIELDDYLLEFDLNVRFVKNLAFKPTKVQIGGFFENMSGKSQAKLTQFVTALERAEIRRKKQDQGL